MRLPYTTINKQNPEKKWKKKILLFISCTKENEEIKESDLHRQ